MRRKYFSEYFVAQKSNFSTHIKLYKLLNQIHIIVLTYN